MSNAYTAPDHPQGGPKHPYPKLAAPDFKQVEIEDFLSDPADDPTGSGRFLSGAVAQVRKDAEDYAKAHPGTDGAKSARLSVSSLSAWVQVNDAAPDNPAVNLATQPARFINRAPYPLPCQDANGNVIDGNAFSANVKVAEVLGILRDMLARDIRNNIASKTRVAGS